MNNEIKSYVNSFIPQTLPKTKQKELFDELLCHILDKADRYEEIGYSKEDSMKKAIDDFGTDETVKNAVSAEFENLYHEKTWWAFIPFAVICLLNYLCFPLDTWIASADWNSDPTIETAFISFIMIFINLSFIFFARAKCYRKMLIGTGIANLLVGINFLACFYPQAALFAIEYNSYLLIDKLTPFTVSFHDLGLFLFASIGFTLLCAVYCFITAALISKGRVHKIKKHRIKAAVLGACFFAVAVSSCVLFPKALAFIYDYPVFFDYHIYSSEETENLYNDIELGEYYIAAAHRLRLQGWKTADDFEISLNNTNKRKEFRAQFKKLNFGEEYEVWFNPDRYIEGNGFVFIKANDDGKVISKGIGDLHPLDYDKYEFRISEDRRDDMTALISDFESLKKGDKQTDIMSRFGVDYGRIYSHFESITNGRHIERFTVYAYGKTNPEMDLPSYLESNPCHIELTFYDGALKEGRMILEEWTGKKTLYHESVIK